MVHIVSSLSFPSLLAPGGLTRTLHGWEYFEDKVDELVSSAHVGWKGVGPSSFEMQAVLSKFIRYNRLLL